ncbi:uncharacterized protein [Epargyreus clarus]|uniref:uncharacterized protein n=1 Tax=Epargyreus clarus TaxID=520877 RepID=UPI003C2B1BDA
MTLLKYVLTFCPVILICFNLVSSKSFEQFLNQSELISNTRRILRGNEAVDTRPYMVYLRPALAETKDKDPNWLCGGVIIDEQYILTSAACIEDAKNFYVVSGTHRWIPEGETNECITNGAKRATWKCVPKNYVYDGEELGNIRWMINDIAIVKVEDDFNFKKRVRGCDFIPQKIAYNNQSAELEASRTVGSIAGWGSTDRFGDSFGRATMNSPDLLETDVILISKKNCKKRWPDRYHYIIDESMICAKDGVDSDSISQICSNDHGGPLVVGHGPTAVVIGIISACLTTNDTQRCYGPFLYTSVWKNRHMISCAIEKQKGATCKRYLRSGNNQVTQTTFDWSKHSDKSPKSKPEETLNLRKDIELRNTTRVGVLSLETATTVSPKVHDVLNNANISHVREILNGTRRIIDGEKVIDNRPYMVYLKLPTSNKKYTEYKHWLCGGVIVHEEYILTSAACIEDAKQFYVVSGTYKYDEEFNLCIRNNARKAVWKCIPRNYVFDGHENDNLRWMNNDIAIVKVEEEFDFNRLVKGCEFVPQPIRYNNFSVQLENPGNRATVVGWGSTDKYSDGINRGPSFSQDLLESKVQIINKRQCKKRWGPRYHNIIDNYMICSKDNIPELSDVCREKYVDCTDVMYSDSDEETKRRVLVPKNLVLHSAHHSRRKMGSGGFCENDHGGPLIYGTSTEAVVIGIISACLVKQDTNICYGPFLYTSVFKNRMLITCAIYKDHAMDCNKLFRSSETHTETEISWIDHPDGPAKNEIRQMRRNEEEQKRRNKSNTEPSATDKVIQHEGIVLRAFDHTIKINPVNNVTSIIKMRNVFYFFGFLIYFSAVDIEAIEVATHLPEDVGKILNDTRRIINGEEVSDGKPYMVYLKLPRTNKKKPNYRTWLCGGVILHEEYILTSAACIEDAEHFYVVSGTYKYSDEDDRYNNPCIKNGAKKAIWKCIPKNYVFDGHENDNIRWMNNDIAVVKIEDGFDFNRRIRGCDFVPKPVCYNNQSQTLENAGNVVTIAGWGTTARYNDWVNRRRENQQTLLDAHVEIIPKNRCKRRWGSRYHNIIDNYMICTKDIGQTMSEICNEKYVDCTDIQYSDEEDSRREIPVKRTEKIPTNLVLHSAYHNETSGNESLTTGRRYASQADGGFCENDHGGPLIYGEGVNSIVIGVISACLVKERTNKCYGPFLYTSVYKNRQFISCAIYKDIEPKCRRQFRTGITHEEKVLSWKDHPDGPAKNELEHQERVPEIVQRANEDQTHGETPGDKVFAESGFIMKTVNETKATNATDRSAVSNPAKTGKRAHAKVKSNSSDVKLNEIEDEGWEFENTSIVDTRRILYSKTVGVGKRPYMVYLQLTKESAKAHKYRGWLCGGVIVDPYYVLTSAACVEDADHFYIVSGTTKFVDSFDYKNNDCVCKHRRKVVWKCIPKNYKFDFQDSIKWSSNDIAIVKVNKPFKFGIVESDCEFATSLVCYNNVSRDLEKAGTKGWIAGWGSGSNFREGVYRSTAHIPENAKCLQEAKVCVMDNEQCAKKWAPRFRNIITQYMICTKDVMKKLSEICDKKYANCTDVETRRHLEAPGEDYQIDIGRHLRDPDDYAARRMTSHGGFCENDHGGPLIVKYRNKERVIGVISACKIDPKSHSCHGPFLYTSVFKNRQFISCAINKDVEENCRRVFRTGITHEEWSVNWDGVEEDDDKRDQDSDEQDEDSPLRQKSDKTKYTKSKKDDSSSSDSDSDSESSREDRKRVQIARKEKNKVEKQTEKPKLKSNKHKSHDKRVGKREGDKKSKGKEKNGRSHLRHDEKEVFYQSSRDENVNEPDENE